MNRGLNIKTTSEFVLFLHANESWLMESILSYAKKYGYVKYTSTLLEAWRISIVGLTESFEMLMKSSCEIPQMSPDDSFRDDAASAFGIKEAKLHRSRGVNLAMFFSLFKYYRQAYLDLVEKEKMQIENIDYYINYLHRFFDRVEIAYVSEWAGSDSEEQIHELSAQNRKLANEKNRYLTLFDSMNSPAIILENDGYIINYNLIAGELFFNDMHAGGYYYSNRDKLKIDLLFDMSNLKNNNTFEWQYGEYIFIVTGKSLHDISGKDEGLVVLFNDITELKKSEDLIMVQLRHVAMRDILGMIAHQWRQPIAAISMGVSTILIDIELENIDTDEFKKISENILVQTTHLSNIIDDFKNFFRPSENKEQVKVEELMLEAKNVIGKMLEESEIELSIESEKATIVNTYSRELLQMFIILLDNAREALIQNRDKNRIIKVTISSDENSAYIMFCDNGGGVDKAIISKIFDPYFSTKYEKDGTGLGLYILKTIIDKYIHGSIKVENLDDGACFTIIIGLKDDG